MRNLCLLSLILILFLGAKEPRYETIYIASLDPMYVPVVKPPTPDFHSKKGRVPDYLKRYYDFAKKVEKDTDIPSSIILAVSALESNWAKSDLSRNYNNFFGRKARGTESFCRMWTTEYRGGRFTKELAKFKSYNSPYHSFADFASLLKENKRYSILLSIPKGNTKEWARGLQRAGYATDPGYSRKLEYLVNLMKQYY